MYYTHKYNRSNQINFWRDYTYNIKSCPIKVSLSNVITPLLDIETVSYTRGVALQLPSMVALDKGLRDASSEAEKKLDEFSVEMSMRKDIFDNLVAFSHTDEAKGLNPELQR